MRYFKNPIYLSLVYGLNIFASVPFTEGISFTASSAATATSLSVSPQNLNGWVGKAQYILMSYGAIRSFNKTTGQADGILNVAAADFFGGTVADVRIDYDRFSDRWFMSAQVSKNLFQEGTELDLVLAMSSEGTITNSTKWSLFKVSADRLSPNVPLAAVTPLDYNELATDANAVYICVHVFNEDSTFSTATVVYQTKSLLARKPIITIFPFLAKNTAQIAPADNFDTSVKFGYLVYPFYPPTNPFPTGNQMSFTRVINPGSAKPTLSSEILVTLPEQFCAESTPRVNVPHLGNLYGATLGNLQYQGGGNSVSAPHVRDNQLYIVQAVNVNQNGQCPNAGGDRIGARWYQFDLTGDLTGQGKGTETATTVPVLVQSGTLFDTAPGPTGQLSYYIPAIMTNKKHDMVIAGTTSSSNTYTDIFYATRSASDPLNTLNPPLRLTNSGNPYNYGALSEAAHGFGGQRWGDESSLSPDPSNDLNIWITGEWAPIYNAWGIQAIELIAN